MQDKKEYILQKAFEVFMAKGYDSASMTVLHQELKISRGAMYRYFESKDELFKAVIDKHFFGLLEFVIPKLKKELTLKERIETCYLNLKKVVGYLDKIHGIEIVFLNYTALIIQAAKHYPGFIERIKDYKIAEFQNWQRAIENSIKKGEIRQDLDTNIMAHIFVKAFTLDNSDTPSRNFLSAAEQTKTMMEYIYSLIKK